MHCNDCGEEVRPNAAWYEVVGWEHHRKGGGTNAIALRTQTGTMMCERCMVARKNGVVVTNQMSLTDG